MPMFSSEQIAGLERAAGLLLEAEDRLPVLRSVSWDRNLADAFFAGGEKEPPRPIYPKIDPGPSLERVAAARAIIDGDSLVHDWLRRFADTTEATAAMLSTIGTKDFYRHSLDLYGGPKSPIADGKRTALDLAHRLDALLSDYDEASIRMGMPEVLTAADLKTKLEASLARHFGDASPRVIVTKKVSAKAAAGRDYIKLRADASFSDLDATQLLQHEALVHIATGMNGRSQSRFPLLAESHPGNARTQEGLAVFAEFISGSLDPSRFKRLADRTIAIDMAACGAGFLELYHFFRERSANEPPFEAFENARRVVRGGVIDGSAPFTKDSVYLGGLLEVHSYLRAAVLNGESRLIRLLFVGKIDLEDLPAVDCLWQEGLIEPPAYMPPWATDLRFLLSYLSYSTFLNEIDLRAAANRYSGLMKKPAAVG
ncbi:MAG: DUF1704 domain-containing protein [Alphaproteobacteria bacterium]|nr:DUF1704 domain-containing protein [Alphaproteobacteria bacterium]